MFFWEMSQHQSSHVAPAVVGSFASLGVGVWRGATTWLDPAIAQVNALPDSLLVFGAIVTGIGGIGWSIYSAGPDRRNKTLTDEIAILREQIGNKDQTIREQDKAIAGCLTERNRLLSEIGRLEGLLARYQAQASDNRPSTASGSPPLAG